MRTTQILLGLVALANVVLALDLRPRPADGVTLAKRKEILRRIQQNQLSGGRFPGKRLGRRDGSSTAVCSTGTYDGNGQCCSTGVVASGSKECCSNGVLDSSNENDTCCPENRQYKSCLRDEYPQCCAAGSARFYRGDGRESCCFGTTYNTGQESYGMAEQYCCGTEQGYTIQTATDGSKYCCDPGDNFIDNTASSGKAGCCPNGWSLDDNGYCQPPAKRSVIPLANMIETTPTRGLRKRKHSHVSVLDPAQAAAYFLGEGQFHHDGEKYRDMHTIDTNERAWRDAIRKDQGTLPRYKVDPWLGWWALKQPAFALSQDYEIDSKDLTETWARLAAHAEANEATFTGFTYRGSMFTPAIIKEIAYEQLGANVTYVDKFRV